MNFDKPGGFRWLDSWVMGSIVQLATHRFCEKFLTRQLDPTGRQYDQMKKRKAGSGPNAGKEFWGSTGYPGCRGVRPV